MKKRILRLCAVLLVMTLLVQSNGGLGVLTSQSVQASGDLTVDWGTSEGSPIFTITNMAPGDIQSKIVSVTNGVSISRPAGIRGVSVSQVGNLSEILTIVIKNGATDIYGGTSVTGVKTLQQFYADSASTEGVFLTHVNPNDTVNFTIQVLFPTTAGNEYQNSEAIFNLYIGVSFQLPSECSGVNFTNIIYGTQNDDHLYGTSSSDLILGFEGDDTIDGKSSSDCIIGGPGNDKLEGENSDDIIKGDEGHDILYGGNGTDTMYGGTGNDILFGDNGTDSLFGDLGLDILFGGNGNDYLNGGGGVDLLIGGNGSDTCVSGIGTGC